MASRNTLVYLDANVLPGAGITRALIIIGANSSSYRFIWSPYAESGGVAPSASQCPGHHGSA